jgi:hypothetical protein
VLERGPTIAIVQALRSSNMKATLAVLLITVTSRLAQGQQALPRWRENRGQAAVEDAILFPVRNAAVQASEQSEGTRISRSRVDSTTTLIDPRSRGSVPGTRSRGSISRTFSTAALEVEQARTFTSLNDMRGSGERPSDIFRGSVEHQAAVDRAIIERASRAYYYGKGKGKGGYGVYSFEAGKGKGKGKGKGGYDEYYYTSGKGKGKGKGKGGGSKSKGEYENSRR